MKPTFPLKIILVDDDDDDHFIFFKTLDEIAIPTELTCFVSGDSVLQFLSKNLLNLPDVIFLDLNMPRKSGSECLNEIKQNKKLNHIPVIVYSTAYHKDIVDCLYKSGAFFCMQKSAENKSTKKAITLALQSILENQTNQPSREKFTLGFVAY